MIFIDHFLAYIHIRGSATLTRLRISLQVQMYKCLLLPSLPYTKNTYIHNVHVHGSNWTVWGVRKMRGECRRYWPDWRWRSVVGDSSSTPTSETLTEWALRGSVFTFCVWPYSWSTQVCVQFNNHSVMASDTGYSHAWYPVASSIITLVCKYMTFYISHFLHWNVCRVKVTLVVWPNLSLRDCWHSSPSTSHQKRWRWALSLAKL